jgi:hypothetical protein
MQDNCAGRKRRKAEPFTDIDEPDRSDPVSQRGNSEAGGRCRRDGSCAAT